MQQSIPSIFFQRAAELDSAIAVKYKEGRSPYRDLTWSEFSRLVKEMAAGLISLGLKPQATAAIISPTSHMWTASDLAIISAGGVSVPIYPTSSTSDIESILKNSQAGIVFVANEALLNKLLSVKASIPQLNKIILLSPPAGGKSLSELSIEEGLVIGLEELQESGRQQLAEKPEIIDECLKAINTDDLLTIIYTSGTTGDPKGVMLTHKNILGVLADLPDIIPINKDTVYLSFLPLSHIFERVCGEFYWLVSGGTCAYAEGIEHVGRNMSEVHPSMILVVPRVLDRIYAKVKSGIEGASKGSRDLINWAVAVGKEMVQNNIAGTQPGQMLQLKFWLAEKMVLSKLRARIGENLQVIVSGGAPATREVIEFFNAIGINTLEGYGLTETSAPITVNPFGKTKAGTVGKAIKSVEVKIAEDGEIMSKGPGVFSGYYQNEQASKEAFTDGWFHTGDIGQLDNEGYLTITDRKKDLIVNSAGKNIAPQRIEAILRSIPAVSQAIVFGDKQKHLVALLTLDETAATSLAHEQNWNFENNQQLFEHQLLKQYLRKEINSLTAELADHERVRKFTVLENDLSVEAGELTATLKIKRNVVKEKYKDLIQALYRDEDALVSSKR